MQYVQRSINPSVSLTNEDQPPGCMGHCLSPLVSLWPSQTGTFHCTRQVGRYINSITFQQYEVSQQCHLVLMIRHSLLNKHNHFLIKIIHVLSPLSPSVSTLFPTQLSGTLLNYEIHEVDNRVMEYRGVTKCHRTYQGRQGNMTDTVWLLPHYKIGPQQAVVS